MKRVACSGPRLVGCLSVLAFLVVGCTTTERLAADVSSQREAAARAWLSERGDAQAPEPVIRDELSLADAVALALANNKTLQSAYQARVVARGRVYESYGAALPNLTASANYTRLDEVSQIEIGPQAVSMGFEDNYAAQLSLRQPLFHGPAIPAALRAAKLYALWSDAMIRAALQGVIFEATKAYYDALLAHVLARVQEQSLRFAEALLRDVQRKKEQGVATSYDVLRAQVEVSNARAEWIRQKNEMDLAMTRLFKVLGVSQKSKVTLTDEWVYQTGYPTYAEALQIALTNRPELYQAEYALRMQKESVRNAQGAYWPQVDFFFTEKWANPDPHSTMRDEWGDAWTAGISASLPIFDGLVRHGRLVQERAKLKQAEIELLNQQESMALDVQQAICNAQNAEELVESQRLNLDRAEEGLRMVQASYREGTKTEVDVLDAQTALTRTRALYHQALYAHCLARVNLQRALGLLGAEWKEMLREAAPAEISADAASAPDMENRK